MVIRMIEFKINGTKYNIEIVDEPIINNESKSNFCLGLTNWDTQKILLKKNQVNIIKTLKHELTHVWLYEYGHNQGEKQFNHEDVCEIVASINDFINEIVDLFKYYTGFGMAIKIVEDTSKTKKKPKKKK